MTIILLYNCKILKLPFPKSIVFNSQATLSKAYAFIFSYPKKESLEEHDKEINIFTTEYLSHSDSAVFFLDFGLKPPASYISHPLPTLRPLSDHKSTRAQYVGYELQKATESSTSPCRFLLNTSLSLG